jgi:uncharacterized repeat protein (TIGR03803 family)
MLAAIIALSISVLAHRCAAQSESILYDFSGDNPNGALSFDASGNLYGVAGYSDGIAYVLVHNDASWTLKTLHRFQGGNGTSPVGSLVFDSVGNLYGATTDGGHAGCEGSGCGVVYELSPVESGPWTETALHLFVDNGKDGFNPEAGLVFDSAGNLYGTTQHGGTHGGGTVYKLFQLNGTWHSEILVNFSEPNYPSSSVVIDSKGNLYGATPNGGAHSKGQVFEVSPEPGGGWTHQSLYSLVGGAGDGEIPYGGVVLDSAGNLYGTTYYGGQYNGGVVFELSPGLGGWTETLLHQFTNGADGGNPTSALVIDTSGNLYGATTGGGAFGLGSVFELSPAVGGAWTLTTLHSFNPNDGDGYYAYFGLLLDGSGNLYGTTTDGGSGSGTAFEVTP